MKDVQLKKAATALLRDADNVIDQLLEKIEDLERENQELKETVEEHEETIKEQQTEVDRLIAEHS